MKRFFRVRKWLMVFLPMTAVVVGIMGAYAWAKPLLRTWIRNQVTELSKANLPVEIYVGNLDWNLFLPTVGLEDIRILPKAGQLEGLSPIQIERISAKIDVFYLLSGRLRISSIALEKPEVQLLVKNLTEPTKPEPLPTELLFQMIKKIPINEISIEKSKVLIAFPSEQLQFSITDSDLRLQIREKSISVLARILASQVRWKDQVLPIKLNSMIELTPTDLILHDFLVSGPSVELKVEGKIQDLKNIALNPSGQLSLDLKANLSELKNILLRWRSLPAMSGRIHLQGGVQLSQSAWTSNSFDLAATDLSFANFQIGDIKIKGQLENGSLTLPEIELHNEAGKITLSKTELQIFDGNKNLNLAIKSQLATEKVNLHQLLKAIDVGDIPIFLDLGGDLACAGPLWPNTKLICRGNLNGKNLQIDSGHAADDNIVKVDQLATKGEVEITQTQVSYKTQLKVMDSEGESSGIIDYKNGFNISFATPDLELKHIRNLANLKLEGSAKLRGTTSGDSKKAVFNINIPPKDIYFSDFFLGDAEADLAYEKGMMNFSPLKGQIGSSSYEAKVAVDLTKSRIQAEGNLPKFETPELLQVFARLFQSPVDLTGTGSAHLKLAGPLKLGALTYELSSKIQHGSVAGENYDGAELELSATDGEVRIQKARLAKNKSTIVMTGEAHPDGDISVLIEGKGFLLEESENVNRLGANIAGLFDGTLTLNGPVLAPDAMIQGKLSSTYIEDLEVPSSQFAFRLGRASIEGSAQLVGDRLKTELLWPLLPESPFYLKIQAQDWNYTTLFALIGGAPLLPEYQASLTGSLNLASERGGILAATGFGKIEQLSLQRGSLALANRGPMELSMKNGLTTLTNFLLFGDQSTLQVKGQQFSSEDLNLNIESTAQLRLFQIFFPFLEELNGLMKVSLKLSGRLEKPELLGDAKVEGGFLKLKAFPHPFERVQAQAQFSQSKVLISDISGQLAGGTFSADGNILIQGLKNLPTEIRAQVQNVSFNVPDRIRTSGDAELKISGNWFPFLLSGTYLVSRGQIDKEFGEDSGNISFRQSSYLPKVILQNAFEPLLLDIQVDLDKGVAVKNSLLEGSVKGSLQVKGSPTSPVILGRIVTEKSAKLFFRETPFEVLNGTVDFKDPTEINPELFISARARKSDYDVNLLIQGSGKAPRLTMSSLPPLSEQDITSLLVFGITSQQIEKKVQSKEQESSTSYAIGTAIISNNPLTKDLTEKTGINLQFSSQYNDTKNVSVQKITINRKLSEKVNASASTLRGEQKSTEVKLQYLINQNVSAIGSWEGREAPESNTISNTQKDSESIFGLDLEFKKEFK